ncbi:hypothetical protein ACFUC1_15655 [Pedococcus sp. NPDC057267]|uniref:hypothetical protein n=1 Tax=Pedococcus sp. NPDC057267 TaxID=3346077 RepID=UPI00363A368D
MQAPFFVAGVNMIDVLVFLALLGAAGMLLVRGRRATWSVLGCCGFGVLALARLANLLSYQWLLRSGGTPVYHRLRVLTWFGAGTAVLGLVGLGLLLAAVLAGRPAPAAGTRATSPTGAGAPPPA